jgi:cbb3-type cytochrome oxidase maturation protein
MEALYLLIPMSVVLVLAVLALFGWALGQGQFDDLEREGERIFGEDTATLDPDQGPAAASVKKYVRSMSREDAPL